MNEEFFKDAPADWSLPITERGDDSRTIWGQREYVQCMNNGFSFARHGYGQTGEKWHYKLPTPGGWVHYTVVNPGPGQEVLRDDAGNPFKTPSRALKMGR